MQSADVLRHVKIHLMKKYAFIVLAALAAACGHVPHDTGTAIRPSEYVSTLVGTQSDYALSTGNTYPAVALPWGMNFWTPQTGPMGDGWAYTYGAHTIRGLQTDPPALAVDQRLRAVFR